MGTREIPPETLALELPALASAFSLAPHPGGCTHTCACPGYRLLRLGAKLQALSHAHALTHIALDLLLGFGSQSPGRAADHRSGLEAIGGLAEADQGCSEARGLEGHGSGGGE